MALSTDAPALTHGTYLVRFSAWAWAVFAVIATLAVVTTFTDGETADAAGTIGILVGMTPAGVLFLSRSRNLGHRERVGWSLVGIGMLIAVSGIVVVAALFFIGREPPAFGWPDLFFFTAYVLAVGGFASLPHTSGPLTQRSRMVLDGMIGAVSFIALAWVFVLSGLTDVLADAPLVDRVIGFVYPFLDVALVTVGLLVLLRRSSFRFDIRLLLFTAALAVQALGDSAFLLSGVGSTFDEAKPVYAINLLAAAAFFAAAYLLDQAQPQREYAERKVPLWALIMPYGAAAGMIAAFLLHPDDRVLLWSTLLVGVLVVARQGVSIRENRQMVEQQRNALVSSISHELRTPLTSIVGFVELLEQEGDTMSHETRNEMTGIVHEQVLYMSRIVADLIMLARGDASEIQLSIAEVELAPLISRSVRSTSVDPSTIVVDCPADLVGFVDADRLQQVVLNLVTNAARYGGPHRLIVADSVHSDLSLEVHDDGPGIPRRYELSVWERFERGPNRLNATVPGSGIGLAVVDAIARAHGGAAGYRRSERLGGACFTITLPGRAAHRQQRELARPRPAVLSPPLGQIAP